VNFVSLDSLLFTNKLVADENSHENPLKSHLLWIFV